MQLHDVFEFVGEVSTPLRLPSRIGVLVDVVRVRQVIDARQHGAEHLAIRRDAANGDAAEADAVIALLAADQPRALALATMAVIGQCDLQCSIHRFRPGIDEERIVQSFGCDFRQPVCQLENGRVPELERHRVIERFRLRLDRLDDLGVAMPGIAAP